MLLPTVDLVSKECAAFLEENELIENTLQSLWTKFPSNTDVSHVYSKVIVLNELYKTRILSKDIAATARHIAAQEIDSLLNRGSFEAVDRIWGVPDVRRCYSFATKYCSWHNPDAFPLYDRYVDECLWSYKKQAERNGQTPFKRYLRQEVWEYEKFVGIVGAFRDHYELGCFTFKQLDMFLWRMGFQMRHGTSG